MDAIIIMFFIIFAIATVCFVFYILCYNKIQKYLVRIQEAESQIDDTLRKRYDILVSMENIVNDVTNLKQNNFANFKSDKMSNFDVDRILTKVTETFNKIKLDYSDELDIDSYRSLLVDLKINQEKCDAAKTYYNKYTTDLNMLIKKFPSNLVARMHGIKTRLYFDNKNMSDDDILDFKL